MNLRKSIHSVLCCALAAALSIALARNAVPLPASAASSSEIRKQIDQLKKEKEALQTRIRDVEEQYEENENDIADLIAQKDVIDQQVQLLHEQIENINQQLSTYSLLIADKQEELDAATAHYREMNEQSRIRVRTMEEYGTVSYWDVVLKSKSFSDLLDRLDIVREIAAADKKHLEELADAADAVEAAQRELTGDKAEAESTKAELDAAQLELEGKEQEAVDLLQALLAKADSLEALQAEFHAQESEFLKQIAEKEVAFSAAKQAEWEAYMATYVPPTTEAASAGGTGNSENSGAGSSGTNAGNTGGTWLVPCSYQRISSPFGNRTSPTAGASTYHQGIDLSAPAGTRVVASRAGIVSASSYSSSAGNYVRINHQDGFSSIYMHLSSKSVSVGQIVSAGQQIGAVGATGIATGNHLHFGISYNGVYVNPANYVSFR